MAKKENADVRNNRIMKHFNDGGEADVPTGGTDSTAYYTRALQLTPKMKAHYSGGDEKNPLNPKRYEETLKTERAANAYLAKKKKQP